MSYVKRRQEIAIDRGDLRVLLGVQQKKNRVLEYGLVGENSATIWQSRREQSAIIWQSRREQSATWASSGTKWTGDSTAASPRPNSVTRWRR